ncbi:hypothetical protein EW026_g300 [Hermanssonia centrifuga]|uniref:Uncharacterized protein n=1 Tax=Hermanssonia centrifuga TaxID=98765 RepID=A0A4S4KV48_9APHY|nr:hypothetical protein EW026_g300 [Hermanssonia centrifuga]
MALVTLTDTPRHPQSHEEGMSHPVNYYALSKVSNMKRVPIVGAEQILCKIPAVRICLYRQPPNKGALDKTTGAILKHIKEKDARLVDAILRISSLVSVLSPPPTWDAIEDTTWLFDAVQTPRFVSVDTIARAFLAPKTSEPTDPEDLLMTPSPSYYMATPRPQQHPTRVYSMCSLAFLLDDQQRWTCGICAICSIDVVALGVLPASYRSAPGVSRISGKRLRRRKRPWLKLHTLKPPVGLNRSRTMTEAPPLCQQTLY